MICTGYCYGFTDSQMYGAEFVGQIHCSLWASWENSNQSGMQFQEWSVKGIMWNSTGKKLRTSGYHPQTNGQCECFSATLISMLGTLPEKPKSTWREQVPTLVHAYNCTRNNATGFSPYYLMFGWKPHLPIDLIFGMNTADLKGNSIACVESLKGE